MSKEFLVYLNLEADLGWHHYCLTELTTTKNMTLFEIRKYSMLHLIGIIRCKKKLGYDYSIEEEKHKKLKKFKLIKS